MKNKNTPNKIQNQITRIEQIIDKLLEGINIEEMSASERLTLAHRFIALHQKAANIQQQVATIEEQPETREVFIVALMSLMRGEKINRDQIVDMEGEDGKDN